MDQRPVIMKLRQIYIFNVYHSTFSGGFFFELSFYAVIV
jgi:hypothetical protein